VLADVLLGKKWQLWNTAWGSSDTVLSSETSTHACEEKQEATLSRVTEMMHSGKEPIQSTYDAASLQGTGTGLLEPKQSSQGSPTPPGAIRGHA
jgi:hypothetical protein